jgi:hypothetical protein
MDKVDSPTLENEVTQNKRALQKIIRSLHLMQEDTDRREAELNVDRKRAAIATSITGSKTSDLQIRDSLSTLSFAEVEKLSKVMRTLDSSIAMKSIERDGTVLEEGEFAKKIKSVVRIRNTIQSRKGSQRDGEQNGFEELGSSGLGVVSTRRGRAQDRFMQYATKWSQRDSDGARSIEGGAVRSGQRQKIVHDGSSLYSARNNVVSKINTDNYERIFAGGAKRTDSNRIRAETEINLWSH